MVLSRQASDTTLCIAGATNLHTPKARLPLLCCHVLLLQQLPAPSAAALRRASASVSALPLHCHAEAAPADACVAEACCRNAAIVSALPIHCNAEACSNSVRTALHSHAETCCRRRYSAEYVKKISRLKIRRLWAELWSNCLPSECACYQKSVISIDGGQLIQKLWILTLLQSYGTDKTKRA